MSRKRNTRNKKAGSRRNSIESTMSEKALAAYALCQKLGDQIKPDATYDTYEDMEADKSIKDGMILLVDGRIFISSNHEDNQASA